MLVNRKNADGSILVLITPADMFEYCTNDESEVYEKFDEIMNTYFEKLLIDKSLISVNDAKYTGKEF